MMNRRDPLPQDLSERARIAKPAERNGHAGVYHRKVPWPKLDDKALYGLAGEIVKTALPHPRPIRWRCSPACSQRTVT